jgi:hypothetical protein
LNEEETLPHVLPKIPEWVDEILLDEGLRHTYRWAETSLLKGTKEDVRGIYQCQGSSL